MVAQRALPYDEVETEWMLFLDDDVFLPPYAVETLYRQLKEKGADVISPDVFSNAKRPLVAELLMTLSGRMRARRGDNKWGYKVMRTAGYSYNANPVLPTYWSQINAGPCFFCRKNDFLKIHFEEELWMDQQKYALGDDQVMFYKMHLCGLKILTSYNSGILHLDAGASRTQEKEENIIYSDFRFKTIFWHRFIFTPERNLLLKFWSFICIVHALSFTLGISLLKGQWDIFKLKKSAIKDARAFLKSVTYHKLPKIKV